MTIRLLRAGWIILSITLPLVPVACSSGNVSSSDVRSPPDEGPQGPVWFEDVTDAVGLDFAHDPGPSEDYFMPRANGSGCGFIYEPASDGGKDKLYIYLLNCAGPDSKSVNRLYLRTPEGKFKDVTAGSGLDVAGYSQGVAVGDVNNDGLPDVLLTQYGGIKLFLNQGNGKFKDITVEAGLSNPLWGTSAAFFDYDRDGWLDLVIANYVDYDPQVKCTGLRGMADFCGPAHFPGTCSKLFRNLGAVSGSDGKSGVRFEDVSIAVGIGLKPGPGLGVVCADFDGDGWPDIFIANDEKPNHLWLSRRKSDGTVFFEEAADSRGLAYSEGGHAYAGMGIALGDVDNKGLFDLFVTHLVSETHTLWKQGPRGKYLDRSTEAGLMLPGLRSTGFGTLMADFDLDGALDLVIVNGAVAHGGNRTRTLPFWERYAQRNQLLANDGKGKFRDLSPFNKDLCGRRNVARGLACADFDDDGAPDLLVTAIGDRARLFRNVAPDRGHWLSVRALDPNLRRDAYGAEVRIQVSDRQMLRLINPAGSFLSSSSPYAYFGLGKADRVNKILVKWPDGPLDEVGEEFDGVTADRHVVLTRGSGQKVQKREEQP